MVWAQHLLHALHIFVEIEVAEMDLHRTIRRVVRSIDPDTDLFGADPVDDEGEMVWDTEARVNALAEIPNMLLDGYEHMVIYHPSDIVQDMLVAQFNRDHRDNIDEPITLTYAPVQATFECPICMCDIEGKGPESIPIVGDTVEGEAWQCRQCGHWICKACMEHWTGSTEQYHIPDNEGEEQYLWEGERHSTCPYCRVDISDEIADRV
jgi:hypothetical protein